MCIGVDQLYDNRHIFYELHFNLWFIEYISYLSNIGVKPSSFLGAMMTAMIYSYEGSKYGNKEFDDL